MWDFSSNEQLLVPLFQAGLCQREAERGAVHPSVPLGGLQEHQFQLGKVFQAWSFPAGAAVAFPGAGSSARQVSLTLNEAWLNILKISVLEIRRASGIFQSRCG